MSDEVKKKELSLDDCDVVAKPFLKRIDDVIIDFAKELRAEGVEKADVYYIIGQYFGTAVGAIGGVQLQNEASEAGVTAVTTDEVLNMMDSVMRRASLTARQGFISVLINKFNMNYKLLQKAEQERVANDRILRSKVPPKDPKDFN